LLALLLIFLIGNVKKSYTADIFFDYYGVKGVYNGQTVSKDEEIFLTVPCEATEFLKGSDYNFDPNIPSPLGNKTGVTIRYVSYEGSLYQGDKLVFKFENVRLSSSVYKCWLVFHEYKGRDTDHDGVGDENVDLNNNGFPFDILTVAESINNVSSSREIVFRVNRKVPAGYVMFLACAEEGEPSLLDKTGFYIDGFDTSYNPVFILDNLNEENQIYNSCSFGGNFRKGCLTVQGYGCCDDQEIPDISVEFPRCFVDMECQFSLGQKPALSIIDIPVSLNNVSCENSKSGLIRCLEASGNFSFLDEPSGDILRSQSCTDEDASGGSIYIKENPGIDDFIVLGKDGWKGKLKVWMYDINGLYACSDKQVGNKLPYKSLDFLNKRVFLDNNGKSYGSRSFGYPENRIYLREGEKCFLEADLFSVSSCVEDNETVCIKNGYWEDDLYIGINREYRLSSVQWGLTQELEIFKDNVKLFSIKIDEKAECIKRKCCYDKNNSSYFLFWKQRGKEIFIPYMLRLNTFRVIVSNNSCFDGDIYARVWDEKGRVAEDVYIGKVKANSVKLLYGDDIFYKARRVNPQLGKGASPLYSVILNIGVPKRDLEVAAYDNRFSKTKRIPAYDLSGEEWTYRNVDFHEDPF
jgi:hypothetical protein